jgi:ketosteroid isomerase-like protein
MIPPALDAAAPLAEHPCMSDFPLLDRLMAAIARGDIEAATACYAPGAHIWHNFDGLEQSVAENTRTLAWMDKRLSNRKYEIVSRHAFAGGFVQQHVLAGTLNNGQPFRMPACIVVQVRDGLIARLDEYLDTAHTKALRLV